MWKTVVISEWQGHGAFSSCYFNFLNHVLLLLLKHIYTVGTWWGGSNWLMIFLKASTYRSFFSSFCSSELSEAANGFWDNPKPLFLPSEPPESKEPNDDVSWFLLPPHGVDLGKLGGWITLEYLWLVAFHPRLLLPEINNKTVLLAIPLLNL